MRIVLLALFLLTLAGCSYDNFGDSEPAAPNNLPPTNTTVEKVRTLAGTGVITDSLVVELAVTSSDAAGNFYKELYGEDISGGMRFKLGIYDIFGIYAQGSVVRVQLAGLAAGIEDGCLVVGAESGGGVVALGPESLIKRHIFATGERRDDPWPLVTSDLNSRYVGRYVEIGDTFVAGLWRENAVFVDDYGHGIYVYTSKYATFYGQTLPKGRVKLRGVIVMNGGRIELRISDLSCVIKPEK